MGVLPLQFKAGDSAATLKLTGSEEYELVGSGEELRHRGEITVVAKTENGTRTEFVVAVRIDTPEEVVAFRNGGILPYVVRQLVARS
jgi:aconitate hydratase